MPIHTRTNSRAVFVKYFILTLPRCKFSVYCFGCISFYMFLIDSIILSHVI